MTTAQYNESVLKLACENIHVSSTTTKCLDFTYYYVLPLIYYKYLCTAILTSIVPRIETNKISNDRMTNHFLEM